MGFEFVLMMVLGMGAGGDLLDYMSSDYYWKMQGVAVVNVEEMNRILDNAEANPTDKLMAIRSLGHLGEDASLAKLQPLVNSNEPFVGMYAKRSIAWIQGVDPEPIPGVTAEQLAMDVALLPPDATMAAQVRTLTGTGPVNWNTMLPNFPRDFGPDRAEMLEEINSGLYEVLSMVGNIRLDTITFGANFHQDEDDGTVYLIARGEYDRFRVIDTMKEMDEEFKGYSVGDIEVLANDSNFEKVVFIMPSDNMMIMMINGGEIALPIDELVDLVENGDALLAFDAEMKGQYDKIDRQAVRGWFITSVPPMFTQDNDMAEIFGPLEAARITATDAEDGKDLIEVSWVGEGKDEAQIVAAVEILNGHLAEGRAEIRQEFQAEPEMREMMQPFVTMMDSMQINADGKNMTGGMTLPMNIGVLMPMFMLGF